MKNTLLKLLILVALSLSSADLFGATITVTTLNDPPLSDPGCSLRQAIQSANTDSVVADCTQGSGADVIELPDLGGPYVLNIDPAGLQNDNSSGDLDICSDITLQGQGSSITVIRAQFNNGMDRVLQIFDQSATLQDPVLSCTGINPQGIVGEGGIVCGPVPIVEINGVTIENGHAVDDFNGLLGGGGILNAGQLTVNDSVVQNNTTDNAQNLALFPTGGGIFNLGEATILGSQIQNNTATTSSFDNGFAAFGGGIACVPGNICLESSLTIGQSQINDNIVENGSAGGLGVFTTSFACDTLVFMSAVYDNQVTGFLGISPSDPLFGTGGGISNFGGDGSDSQFSLVDSTVSGNIAPKEGGGFFEVSGQDTLTELLSSTIAFNQADTNGGGIKRHRTSIAGTLSMMNTIVSNNEATTGPDCFTDDSNEPITSVGYNLILNTADCTLDGAQTGDITGQDPLLGVLVNNGGLTPTHALPEGSPAIDTGRPVADGGCVDAINAGATLEFDQRDNPFERTVAGVIDGTPRCDIGAYEFVPQAPPPPPPPPPPPVGNIFIEGSGIIPCSLQQGPVANHLPITLMGILGFGLGALILKRKSLN